MACMANEPSTSSSSSPTPAATATSSSQAQQHKRCSLPGPMGSLNLYTTHQQRRLSERGLMIYRPSKPDIDLIGDFINPNKSKTVLSGGGGFGLSSSPPTGGIPLDSISFGSGSGLPTITSPSRKSKSARSSSISNPSTSTTGNYYSSAPGVGGGGGTGTTGSGCRKVRLRIQKNPGGKENVEIQNVMELSDSPAGGDLPSPGPDSGSLSSSSNSSPDHGNLLLTHPNILDSRRFSDSVTYGTSSSKPPLIQLHPSSDHGGSGTGIVCLTGDLRALKCLTSSAQEIQWHKKHYEVGGSRSSTPTPENLGNRSRSFDATYNRPSSKKHGIGSSWFSRRHLPISGKLPISLNSPSVPSSPGPNQLTHKVSPPILTVTNESCQSEIIEVPSPPAVTPSESRTSPEHNAKVPWDRSGFLLDAAVLGSVIENHLRKTDMKRRATVSTLYEPELPLPTHGSTRARSASASVIAVPGSLGDSGSIFSSTGGCSGSSAGRRTSLSIRTNNLFAKNDTKLPIDSAGIRRNSNSNLEPWQSRGLRTKEKRSSLSGTGIGTGTTLPVSSSPGTGSGRDRERSQSLYYSVETKDPNGKALLKNFPSTSTPPGQIFTQDELLEESRRRQEYYRKVSLHHQQQEQQSLDNETNQQQSCSNSSSQSTSNTTRTTTGGSHSHGLSICTAIRDFIIHSLRS